MIRHCFVPITPYTFKHLIFPSISYRAVMLQDTIAAILIIGVVWLIVKLAFGSSDSSSSAHTRAVNASRQGQGPGKESAAVKAWRDARGDREKDLKQKKQEMLEAARRKYIEKGDSSNLTAGPSGSSGPSSSHAPHSQVLSTS